MSYGLSKRLEREIYEEGYSVTTKFISGGRDENDTIEFYLENKKIPDVLVEVIEQQARVNILDMKTKYFRLGILYPETEVDELAYFAIKQFRKNGIPKVNVDF